MACGLIPCRRCSGVFCPMCIRGNFVTQCPSITRQRGHAAVDELKTGTIQCPRRCKSLTWADLKDSAMPLALSNLMFGVAPIACPYCSLKLAPYLMGLHILTCEKFIIPCNFCKKPVADTPTAIRRHLKRKCTELPCLECLDATNGFTNRGLATHMDLHRKVRLVMSEAPSLLDKFATIVGQLRRGFRVNAHELDRFSDVFTVFGELE